MNFKNLKTLFVLSALGVITLAGCLKDKPVAEGSYNINLSNAPSLVEILGTQAGNPLSVVNLDYSTNDTTFDAVIVSVTADKPVSKDVKVTLIPDTSLISAYNLEHSTDYEELPANQYTIATGLEVTIPAGSREGSLKIKAKPSFIATGVFALGFKIGAVSDPGVKVSSNFKEVVVAIGVKNRYDAIYTGTFQMLDWDAGYGISNKVWTWPAGTIEMRTTSASSVNMFSALHGSFIQVAQTSAGALTGFGSTNPRFDFDLATNKLVSVSNDVLNPANGRTMTINSLVTTSRFDPVTKNIYASYILKQPGRPDLTINATLVYYGPR